MTIANQIQFACEPAFNIHELTLADYKAAHKYYEQCQSQAANLTEVLSLKVKEMAMKVGQIERNLGNIFMCSGGVRLKRTQSAPMITNIFTNDTEGYDFMQQFGRNLSDRNEKKDTNSEDCENVADRDAESSGGIDKVENNVSLVPSNEAVLNGDEIGNDTIFTNEFDNAEFWDISDRSESDSQMMDYNE